MRRLHIHILGIASLLSVIGLIVVHTVGSSRLVAFGPTAQIYFSGIKSGLFISSIILIICFVGFLIYERQIDKARLKLVLFWNSLTNTKRNLLIISLCIVFSFVTHAGNIVNGYFNLDDFIVTNLNHSESFSRAVFTPYANDHAIPLFRTEMKVLDSAFGQSQIPMNILIFSMFALIPFMVYLTLKRLNYSIFGSIVFLAIFNSATQWADMLTGFYMMSLYLQIIFFFSIATWSFVAWLQSKKWGYMVSFAAALLFAVATDTAGLWTLPAALILMLAIHYARPAGFGPKRTFVDFLKKNLAPLCILVGAALAFALLFYVSFDIIQPHTFLTTLGAEGAPSDATQSAEQKAAAWRPLPLAENFVSFTSSGVSLPIIVPNTAKILAHPALVNKAGRIWPYLEWALFILNIALFWIVIKNASGKDRKFIWYILAGMVITTAMVIVARPNHNPVPDYDYRYAGAPLYFYALFLAVSAALYVKAKGVRALKICIACLIIIIATQQAFGFHAIRLRDEAQARKSAITGFAARFLPELRTLSSAATSDSPLLIPNLTGSHIYQTGSGLTLANYLIFFNEKAPLTLIQNKAMSPDSGTHSVLTVKDIAASTSPVFIKALKSSEVLRDYYGSAGWMIYTIASATATPELTFNTPKTGLVNVRSLEFAPGDFHRMGLWIYTDNVAGNVEIPVSFNNDFNLATPTGTIRIDDYTPYTIIDSKRVYHIETDLLQLIPFALSNSVSDLAVHIPEVKNAVIVGISLR